MASVLEEADRLPEVGAEAEPERGVSVLDALRAKRAEVARSKPRTLLLDIPGYDGRLVVRYHFPDAGAGPALEAGRRSRESNDAQVQVDASCDLLIAACDEVLGRNDAGDVVPLDPSRDEHHKLRLGKPLGELLDVTAPDGIRSPARYVVRALFSPRGPSAGIWDGDLALINHSGRVAFWLNGIESEAEETFAGES